MDYSVEDVSESTIRALLDSIRYPAPTSIEKLKSQGAFHLCYFLEYSEQDVKVLLRMRALAPSIQPHNATKLLLRISGKHLPHRKTENESAILAYVAREAPGLPVPTIVHSDSSTDNALGHEYQIMTVCPGVAIDDIFREWDAAAKADFLDQVVQLLQMFHSIPVNHIGGFTFAGGRDPKPGPICEEFMLKAPDVEKYWKGHGPNLNLDTLNAQGPFENWTELNEAWLNTYMYAIESHPLMREFRDMIPRLTELTLMLHDGGPEEWKLNDMRIVVAHRDLHFGNIMYDVETRKISGVIDWEFSGAAPFCKWDPPKAFLASQPFDEEGLTRKRGWVQDFKNRCDEKEIDWRSLIFDYETGWSTNEQRLVFEAIDYMRCIFEVAPTGQRLETVRSWRGIVIQRLDELNIK